MVEKGDEEMKRIVLALAFCALSTGALAQSQTSVPKEITGYKKILVSFSEGAKKCNLEDPAAYSARLSEKLAEIGIPQSDENLLVVTLGVSGQNFGMIGGHCVSMVELKFNAALSKDNIVTSDARARQADHRVEEGRAGNDRRFGREPEEEAHVSWHTGPGAGAYRQS
jgi:hypothetical protein